MPIKNIFLIGYRGVGKTTVAPILAARLGWNWVDADTLLEERHGRSIRDIFDQEGETGFRDKEAALLEELCSAKEQVIATGGGVVLRPANQERLRASGWTVWLTVDANTLWQRLQHDSNTAERRPVLTVGGLEEIRELLRLREPLYRSCADVIIDSTHRSPVDVSDEILSRLADARRLQRVDVHAAAQLLPLVYDELRRLAAAKLAHEPAGHTLDATALVHEAYLKLGGEQSFATKSAFMRAAAEAMRRVLVDHARAKRADKRGGDRNRIDLTDAAGPIDDSNLIALDEALVEFARVDPEAAELVQLRYFTGLTIPQAAEALGISARTADRTWVYARAWLFRRVSGERLA
jgi:RNA polymerase sigma factor (TIGR02999 family)